MPFTNYFDQLILANLFGGSSSSAYVGSYTATSTPAVCPVYFIGLGVAPTAVTQYKNSAPPYWGFVEPSGNGYTRVAITNDTTNWAATAAEPTIAGANGSGYTVQNNIAVTFPQSTGPWGGGNNITNLGVWDALTGGNLLVYAALATPQAVAATSITIAFAVGAVLLAIN